MLRTLYSVLRTPHNYPRVRPSFLTSRPLEDVVIGLQVSVVLSNNELIFLGRIWKYFCTWLSYPILAVSPFSFCTDFILAIRGNWVKVPLAQLMFCMYPRVVYLSGSGPNLDLPLFGLGAKSSYGLP